MALSLDKVTNKKRALKNPAKKRDKKPIRPWQGAGLNFQEQTTSSNSFIDIEPLNSSTETFDLPSPPPLKPQSLEEWLELAEFAKNRLEEGWRGLQRQSYRLSKATYRGSLLGRVQRRIKKAVFLNS